MDQEVCRLCLSRTDFQAVTLFQKVSSNFCLAKLINEYFDIGLTENDQFSKLVCKACVVKLNDFNNFASEVKRNNEFLLQTSNSTNSEASPKKESEDTDDKEIKSDNDFNIEQFYIKEDLYENETAAAAEEDSNSECSDECPSENKDEAENLPNVEPQVILEESSDSEEDRKIVTRKRSANKKKSTEKSSNYPETANDIQIKKFYKYECDLCKEHSEITSFRAFKIHYKTKHGIAAYIKCCGKKFKRPYALVGHIEEHLMPDSLVCSICNKKLRTKQTLLLHMDTHVPVDQRPLKCKYCDMRFVRNHFLVQHEKVHLTDDQLKYICDLCGKRFPTDWRLKTHLNSTHSDEKPFVCEVCARSFKLKVQLQNHMYIHNSKEEAHKQCEHCGIWLRSPRSYYVHMKEKHDESAPKSFPCDKCTHVSPTRKALYAHSINKHGPKKHYCVYCGDGFSSSNLLKSHLIKHTGPGEPLKCPFCPKTFSFRSGYYSHKKKVHPNMTESTNTNNK